MLRPLQQRLKSPPLFLLGILPRAPLLLTRPRTLREPQPLALLMQVTHAQDLMPVPRANVRKHQVLPGQQGPLHGLAEIL